MPKQPTSKLIINLDLLKPQSDPEKIITKFITWLLKSGRYIFIFVEAIVLIAFITRFRLDEDLATTKEEIEQQIPYIESLKTSEIAIRRTQLKLSNIETLYKNSPDYGLILKHIADQTPSGIKILNLGMETTVGKVSIRLSAQSQNNPDIATLVAGLKQDKLFSEVELESITFEKSSLDFSLTAKANLSGSSL